MMANLFLSVLGISVSAGFIVAVLLLLTSVLNKRYAAKWKYWIWIFLALRLLVPFSGMNGQSVMDMLSQMKAQTASESGEKSADTYTLADGTAPLRRVIVELPSQMTAPIAMQSEKNSINISLLDIMAFVWIMGSFLFILVHLSSYMHYKRQVKKRGTVVKDARILHQMHKLKGELQIKCAVPVIAYAEVPGPMIIGFARPILVLPKEQYASEELFFILKHELVHLKRKDVYFKLLFVAANAVHWFNPLIWIMQKEAAVDMEISCDERVVQGMGYAVRKAYTEALLSMLHKGCSKKTILSTQFYGGKEIMKKRFKNILIRKEKKNGILLLLCAVVLTISLGTLVGCQASKEDAKDASGQSGSNSGEGEILAEGSDEGQALAEGSDEGQALAEGSDEGQVFAKGNDGNSAADNEISDDTASNETGVGSTMTFSFSKEGETEEKPATLVVGDGYSFYLPDNEWLQSDSNQWTLAINEKVLLWVTSFGSTAASEIEEKLTQDGYKTVDGDLMKQEGETIYKVRLKEYENDVWGIYYCYPAEAEEGWGRELPVIADTFAVSIAENAVQG